MMRVALVSILVSTLWSPPRSGDVDVSPDEWAPNVRIDAGDGRPASDQPAADDPAVQTGQPQMPDDSCDYNFLTKVNDCSPGLFGQQGQDSAPELTVGDIRRAVRQISMPRLTLTIQPGEATLVNVPTIFHTTPTTLRRSLTLLGQDVDVVARPTSYTWHHGDGTAQTTSSPGRPYPAKDVTHRYRDPDEYLTARVDTTYTVEYRVEGGDWTDLGAALTAAGPSTTLDVHEAAPVLVKRR